MTPRKPGHGFWILTWLTDLFTPGTGSHRINDRLQVLYEDGQNAHERNFTLEREVNFLRRQLAQVEGERQLLIVQDYVNDGIAAASNFVNQKLPPSSMKNMRPGVQPFHDHESHGQR